jgi:predicted esterase
MHEDQPLLQSGVALDQARAALIMLHGRDGAAEDMLAIARQIRLNDLAALAPSADDGRWFPYSSMVPTQQNEPSLSSAMNVVHSLVQEAELSGVPTERIFLFGFSQGGSVALEYAARKPRAYGGVVGLSAGLIGPPGTSWESEQSLAGTPVFLGCSDVDPQMPRSRVEESAEAFKALRARVFVKFYPGMGHTINAEEIKALNQVIAKRMAAATAAK